MRLVAAVVTAALAALLVWRLGRRVLARRLDPALAEHWWRARHQATRIALVAMVAIIILAGPSSPWLLPLLWLALAAAWFQARRPLYGETWSLRQYLSWTVRVVAALLGPQLLIVLSPVLVASSGAAWPAATGILAVLAVGRLAGSRRLLLWLLAARPLEADQAPELFRAAADIATRSTAPRPELYRTDASGGRWANAVALGHRTRPAVVFSRTLMEVLEPAELAAIHAHEVAHLEHDSPRVLRRRGLLLWLLTIAALALVPIDRLVVDLGWWAPLAWLVVTLVSLGAAQARHRDQETASDLRAVELCGDAEALASALTVLHRVNLFPRRLEGTQEATQTHPSLARRLQAIRAAGEATPPRPGSLPLGLTTSRAGQRVLLEDDRITWLEGVADGTTSTADALRRAASAAHSLSYGELTELRVAVRSRGRAELVAVDRRGGRRTVAFGPEAIAPLQAALDEVDSRLAAPRVAPVLAAFAGGGIGNRLLAAVTGLLAFALPGRGAIAIPLLLAAAWPRVPALAAAAAAAITGALLELVRPQPTAGLVQPTGTISVLVLVSGILLGGSALARGRLAPLEGGRHRGRVVALLGSCLGLLWALVAATALVAGGGHIAAYPLHAAVAGSPGTVILGVALVVLLLIPPSARTRLAAAACGVLVALSLALGSGTFRDRFSTDLLVGRGPDAEVEDLTLEPVSATAVDRSAVQLRLAPGGAGYAVGGYQGYRDDLSPGGSTWRVVFGDGGTLEGVAAQDVRFVDGSHALAIGPDGTGSPAPLHLQLLPDDGWRVELPALTLPELGVDEAGGRWSVTGAGGWDEDGASFFRIGGAVHGPVDDEASWRVSAGYVPIEWIPVDARVVMTTVLRADTDPGAPAMVTALVGLSEQRSVLTVSGAEALELGSTSLALRCRSDPDGATCAAWDRRRMAIWRLEPRDGTVALRCLGALSGVGVPVAVETAGRRSVLQMSMGEILGVTHTGGPVLRLRPPVGGQTLAVAVAAPDRLAVLRRSDAGTSLSVLRWPSSD